MEEKDIMSLIPRLYFLKGGKNRYQILKFLGLDHNAKCYKKIDELIDMGFLKRISENPPAFEVDKKCKKNMWDFFKNTNIGNLFIRMHADREFIF